MSASIKSSEEQVISISERKKDGNTGDPANSASSLNPLNSLSSMVHFPQIFYEIESICTTIRQLELALRDEKEKNRMLQAQFAIDKSKFQSAVNVSHQQIRDLNNEIAKLNVVKAELEQSKKILAVERQKFNTQTNHLHSLIKHEQSRLEALNFEFDRTKENYEGRVKESQDKYFQACLQEEKLKNQLQAHINQSEKLREQINNLTFDLQRARLGEQDQVSKNQVIEAKLSETISDLQKHKQDFHHYQNELNNAKIQLSSVQTELIQTRKDLNFSITREKSLKDSFDHLQLKSKELVDELTDTKFSQHTLEDKLKKLTDDFNKTSMEAERLRLLNSTLEQNNQKWGIFLLQDFMSHKNREIERIKSQLATIPETHPDRNKVEEILALLNQQKDYLDEMLRSIETQDQYF